eukprot:2097653-Alexandrium_andersonii.AAC.1
MPWVMLTRLGARSTRARGGCAAGSCGTWGMTCGGPAPADADSARHTQGTGTKPCKASRDQRSSK